MFDGPGNIGRNHFYGPGFVDFDLSFMKTMRFTERVNAQLRVEGYNIFNHPHFTNLGADPTAIGNQGLADLWIDPLHGDPSRWSDFRAPDASRAKG